MASLEDFWNLTCETAEKVGKKTGELVDVTKLKMELSSVEKELSATLEGLGRVVYNAHHSGEDVSDTVSLCIEHAEELSQQAEALRRRIDERKHSHR